MTDAVISKPRLPTAVQAAVLEHLLAGGVMYGPMDTPGLGNHNFGWSGREGPKFNATSGRTIFAAGWLSWTRDKYPHGYYTISDEGKAALDRHKAAQASSGKRG